MVERIETGTGVRLETRGGSLLMDRHSSIAGEGWHCHTLVCDGSDPYAVFRLMAEAVRFAGDGTLYITMVGVEPRMVERYMDMGFIEAYTVYARKAKCQEQ